MRNDDHRLLRIYQLLIQPVLLHLTNVGSIAPLCGWRACIVSIQNQNPYPLNDLRIVGRRHSKSLKCLFLAVSLIHVVIAKHMIGRDISLIKGCYKRGVCWFGNGKISQLNFSMNLYSIHFFQESLKSKIRIMDSVSMEVGNQS